MLTKSSVSSKTTQSKIRLFQNKIFLKLSATVPGGTWWEHSPVPHSYLLLLLDTNFYGNKVSPTRVEMCSLFHLLWNYCVLSTEPCLSCWSRCIYYPPPPPTQLLNDFKNWKSFLQTSFDSKPVRRSTRKVGLTSSHSDVKEGVLSELSLELRSAVDDSLQLTLALSFEG